MRQERQAKFSLPKLSEDPLRGFQQQALLGVYGSFDLAADLS